jgi:hypothetical protein
MSHVEEMITSAQLAKTLIEMVSEGMQAYDCLQYAIDQGLEYPDALWTVTRALRLDDDQVYNLEEEYQYR